MDFLEDAVATVNPTASQADFMGIDSMDHSEFPYQAEKSDHDSLDHDKLDHDKLDHDKLDHDKLEQKTRKVAAFRRAVLASQAKQLQRMEAQTLHQRIEILGTAIDSLAWDDLLKRLDRGIVFTPNVDHLMTLQRDPEFRAAYSHADYRLCDSQVLLYASKFLGKPIQAKISGSDLLSAFCDHHRHNEKTRIFLLGGAEGVPQKAQANLNARYGREIVVAAHSPSFGFEQDEAECQRIVEMICRSSANVLVVGVGAPKQEKWIVKHRNQLPTIDIFMGLGATIDFEAGCKPRSPKIISNLGLEWLYRLASEPRRLWRRYLLHDMPFFWLLLKQKLSRQQG